MARDLLSTRVLKRSLVWNAASTVLPLAAAIVAMPFLIAGLGNDRFGLLAIFWAIIGYAGLFDLGMGRALTQQVASRLGTERALENAGLLWSALFALLLLGVAGAILLWSAAPALVSLLKVPEQLVIETVMAFRILAFSLPFVFVTAAFSGMLEAYQRFDVIALVRTPLSLVTTLGPLLVLLIAPDLTLLSILFLCARALGSLVFGWSLFAAHPELLKPGLPQFERLKILFHQGGWMTVSNIIGPLLSYLDRFFVGAILGTAAVAWYVTPYEVLSRLSVIPAILFGVLFPAMTSAWVQNTARAVNLYENAALVTRNVLLALCVFLFLFAPELLTLWLGAEFAEQATTVARWLAAGVWINALAYTPFTFLQGAGRADLPAKTHLVEMLPYFALLFWATHTWGISGTAMAWTARVLADTLIMNFLARRVEPRLSQRVQYELLWLGCGLVFFALTASLENIWLRLALVLIMALYAGKQLLPFLLRAIQRK